VANNRGVQVPLEATSMVKRMRIATLFLGAITLPAKPSKSAPKRHPTSGHVFVYILAGLSLPADTPGQ
jgi:hypothetical protein